MSASVNNGPWVSAIARSFQAHGATASAGPTERTFSPDGPSCQAERDRWGHGRPARERGWHAECRCRAMTRSDATTRHFVLRSIPEAARETGVPEATLRRWVDDRSLSAVPLGRTTVVNMLEVEALRARAVPDPGPPGGDRSAHDR